MTTEARMLIDSIAGWLLWSAYFGGIAGCWAWLVIITKESN